METQAQNRTLFEMQPDSVAANGLYVMFKRPIERLLLLDKLAELYRRLDPTKIGAEFLEQALEALDIRIRITNIDRSRVPGTGGLIIVSNHPFGAVEGMIVASVIRSVRPDVRVLANSFLGRIPQLEPLMIKVNPFEDSRAARFNLKGLRTAVRWLAAGGALVTFPAGEVSHLDVKRRAVTDPEWSHTIARLAKLTGAAALPVYFDGANGKVFQIAGLVHPRVRTALLPRELLNKRGREIDVRIGTLIPSTRLSKFQNCKDATDHLRQRTYVLSQREVGHNSARTAARHFEALASPIPGVELLKDIHRLAISHTLIRHGEFLVICAGAWEMPKISLELGRLREEAFRQAGEGTGRARDLDEFDGHYLHLFVWNARRQRIVGAYRLAKSDQVIQQTGKSGLYTRTLFEYDDPFLSRLGPSLELGRAFITAEYQRSFLPLLLLWRGIGQILVRNPQYTRLFGAVSISNGFTEYSRDLLVAYLKAHNFDEGLGALVKARNPYRQRGYSRSTVPQDVRELDDIISSVEADGKAIPVLLRQYLRLGGQFASFNVDRAFGDPLDGLIIVELSKIPSDILSRVVSGRNHLKDDLIT